MKRPIWFKAKRYGWGWYPATWQGWVIIGVFVLLIIADAQRLNIEEMTTSDILAIWLPDTIILALMLIAISWMTGEKPRWRWGKN